MNVIKIKGITNPARFEDYIASDLVDIILNREIVGNIIILTPENDINLNNMEDRKWITEIISEGLLECQELSAKIVFE